MRIYEIMFDEILYTKIFEQALRRRDVESAITSLSVPITKHLVKLLKWHDTLNYDKHIGDINNWLFDIQRLIIKGGKRPTQSDYFTWMFKDVLNDEETLDRMIRGLHQYSNLLVIRKNDEVYNIIKNIMFQLSYDLELNDFDDIQDYLPK